MKKRMMAIVASILIFSGAGVYAAKSGSSAEEPVPAASVSTKSTDAPASASASGSQTVTKTSVSSCPASKTVTAVQSRTCAGSETQNTSASSQKSADSSAVQTVSQTVSEAVSKAVSQAASQSAASCARNTGCANVQVLTQDLSGGGQCTGSNCYQYILNYLRGSCGQSVTSSSAPASSAPAASSKPAASSSASAASSTPAASSSAPASSSSVSDSYASFRNQVVQLVNQERASSGLNALTVDSALTNTATLKSQDMAKLGYFDHMSPTYGSPFDMMRQFGISYRTAGENIAMGQTSPSQVMQGWMNSKGHRENILNTSYTKIGVGIAQNSSGQYYWTQQFIG